MYKPMLFPDCILPDIKRGYLASETSVSNVHYSYSLLLPLDHRSILCVFSLQITTLVNAKEKPIKSERTLRALVRVGQAVNLAVERFVSVGESIAEENPEIQHDMCDACKEARAAGRRISIERKSINQ